MLALLLLPCSVYGWQHVIVHGHAQEEISQRELRDRVMNSGFRQAVSQEVDRIIHAGITSQRKSALMDLLHDRVDGLVQGYRQVVWTRDVESLSLEMEVNVDTELLRNMLQKIGLYYTSDEPWTYDLNTRGASPEDFYRLQDLQLITGAVVQDNADTRISLHKSSQGLWMGSLEHGDISLSVSGYDLSQIWFDLWEYFFSSPEIAAGFVKNMVLETWGWPTTDAVMTFDMILEDWDREIEFKKISWVIADINALRAGWKIRSISPNLFKDRLEDYLLPRGIKFNTQGCRFCQTTKQ